jgi:polysaccharide chain length determinant protein (PEP-CTERM system associated)
MLPGRKYTLDDARRILWNGKWIILLPIVPGLVAGLLVARAQPEMFKSSTLIQVLQQRVPDAFVKTTVTSTVEERLKSIEEVVKSRTALETMITSLDLYPGARPDQMESLVSQAATNLEIKVAGNAPGSFRGPGPVNALRVTFTHPDKNMALKVTQRVTAMLLEENAKLRGNQANATNQFLERQLAATRAKLEEQERKVEDFRQRYAGRLPTQVQSNMQAVQTAQSSLSSIVESMQRDRDRKYMLERLYNEAAAQVNQLAATVPPMPGQGQTDPTGLPTQASAAQRLAIARAQLEAMQLRLKPEHPDIRRQTRIIGDLEKLAAAEAQQASTPSASGSAPVARVQSPEELRRRESLAQQKAEIEALGRTIVFKENEERRLRGVIGDYQGKIESIPGVESEWARLDRDYATINESYKQLLTKSQDAQIAANLEENQVGEQFKVLDAPQVSDQATSTNRMQINLIGAVAGLFIGFAIVALRELRDSSFRTENDILTVLSLPVLANVPFAPSKTDLARERKQRLFKLGSAACMMLVCAVVVVALRLWKFMA